MSRPLLKKGLEKQMIVIMAVSILTLAILIYFIGGQTRFAGQRVKDIECKQSVIKSVETREAWIATNVTWADIINCPPHYLTLNTDDKDFNAQFVKELVDCWDKMGEGKLDLFGQEDAVFCVVCSVVEEFKGKKKISGIEDYMKKTKISAKDITIWDYLVGESEESELDIDKPKFGGIDTSKPHAVLYVHGKTASTWSTEYQKWVVTNQGVTFGILKGGVALFMGWDRAADWDARLAGTVYDEDSLRALGCEVIEQ